MKMKTYNSNSLRWVRRGDNAYQAPRSLPLLPLFSPPPLQKSSYYRSWFRALRWAMGEKNCVSTLLENAENSPGKKEKHTHTHAHVILLWLCLPLISFLYSTESYRLALSVGVGRDTRSNEADARRRSLRRCVGVVLVNFALMVP